MPKKRKRENGAPVRSGALREIARVRTATEGYARRIEAAPTDNGMGFAIEFRVQVDGQEIGVDHIQIADGVEALEAVLTLYDGLGVQFSRLALVWEGEERGEESHEQVLGRLTKANRRRLVRECATRPMTACAVGVHEGEVARLYVRSNFVRRGKQ